MNSTDFKWWYEKNAGQNSTFAIAEMAFRHGQETARDAIAKAGPLWLEKDLKPYFSAEITAEWRANVGDFFRRISL